jgi:hypothetical protein
MVHILDDQLAASGLAQLERSLPYRIVGDMVANAKDAVGTQSLAPRNSDLPMEQSMIDPQQ